jgi:hypothetical protein
LFGDLLDWQSFNDFVSYGWEEGQNGVCAVLLVLLEATSQAGPRLALGWPISSSSRTASLLFGDPVVAHALARLGDLAQDILASDVADTDDAGAHGEARTIASEPTTRSSNHRSIEGWSGVGLMKTESDQCWHSGAFVASHPPARAMTDAGLCLGLLARVSAFQLSTVKP